jgi:antitoxin PrlF
VKRRKSLACCCGPTECGPTECGPAGTAGGGFKVESLVAVDDRGQMVLPKELRDKAKIGAGDKFAVISWEKEGKVCCFTLIRAEELAGMVRGLLEPLMGEFFRKQGESRHGSG